MPVPHFSLEQQVLRYYESGQEADRLESPFFHWEYVRTLDLLDRFLPDAPAVILDVGGAAGAYAFRLAEKGYVVDLVDPVPLHIEQAKQKAAIEPCVPRNLLVGDARAIPFGDAVADAVRFFGPLYRLTDSNHRLRAICEAHRVLRAGGVLLAVAISRCAHLPVVVPSSSDAQLDRADASKVHLPTFARFPFRLTRAVDRVLFKMVTVPAAGHRRRAPALPAHGWAEEAGRAHPAAVALEGFRNTFVRDPRSLLPR